MEESLRRKLVIVLRQANPYNQLLHSLSERIVESLSSVCVEPPSALELIAIIEEPPRKEFGDLGIPVPRLLKRCRSEFNELAEAIANGGKKHSLVKGVSRVGPYVDFFIDPVKYGELVINTLREVGEDYGIPKAKEPARIVVEYVSANPIHPLHVGSGRNAALGDFIYRVLKYAGHEVERRYYVDDVGLQVAYLAYGYIKLGRPAPPENVKPDYYYGLIYAATTTIIDIIKLKKELEASKQTGNETKQKEILTELDKLVADLQRIREKIPEEVDKLIEEIGKDPDPESSVAEIVRNYERGGPGTDAVREVTEKVMEGIKQTLLELGVEMDKWDWESDLIKEGLVTKILEEAERSPYYTIHKGVPALDFSELLKKEGIRERLKIPKGLEIPPLILVRGDGTTLYTTRDIAYTIKKFREFKADKIINVIAVEQTLSQAQLRLALYAIGYEKEAENTVHYSYEMVNLPGTSMSGRRGRYVTIDELLSSMKEIIKKLMESRGGAGEDVAAKVARSAFRYMMLSTSPNKTLVFDINRALDLKQLSGPYLQYTYARANAVIQKAGGSVDWEKINYEGLAEESRKELLWKIGKFPAVTQKVLETLQPEDLVAFLNEIADAFNTWYDKEPIAKEKDEGLRALKLAITYGVMACLATGMRLLGMDVLPRI